MSNPPKRKLSCKSLNEKYLTLKDLEKGLPNKDVAAKYEVPQNTVSTWLKNKIVKPYEAASSCPKVQKLKTSKHENLDQALFKWVLAARSQDVPINGPILKTKAVTYAKELGLHDFRGSEGFVDRWKKRHNIKFKTISGESNSCTADMTAGWEQTTLPTTLSNYELRDIYNADEFGLFFKALPHKSLHSKSEKCTGGKHSKVRLTGLAAANAEGDKLPMFVIGKSAKPRCFSGVRTLPCRYRSQSKNWMDSMIFEEWVRKQDGKFELEERKIALIVDNCPTHPQIQNLKAINLIFLPPNSTCKMQPFI